MDAAADLLYLRGVTSTRLDAVLAASGRSKSQLYHHVDGKDDLVLAVIRHNLEVRYRGDDANVTGAAADGPLNLCRLA